MWMYGTAVKIIKENRKIGIRRQKLAFGIIFLALLLIAGHCYADNSIAENRDAENPEGKALFDQGVQASRAGDHLRAGQFFSAALLQGFDVPALHYNLGVTYYRLGNYQKSKAEFQKLLNNKKLSPVACYNLGLIAARNGEDRVAINYFGIAYNISESPELRQLSKIALDRYNTKVEEVSSQDPSEVESGTDGFVSIAMVNDNNVSLVNEDLYAGTEMQDSARELLISVNSMLVGSKSSGLQLSALADFLRYRDIDVSNSYDSSQYHGALRYINEQNLLQMQYEAGYDSLYIGGKEFQRIGAAAVRARLYLDNANYLRMSYQFMSIDSDDILYQYLDGVRHKINFDITFPKGEHKYRFGLMAEANKRKDDSNPDATGASVLFRSYSAFRATLRAAYYYRISQDWRFKLDMRYRRSQYNDEDRLLLSSAGELRYLRIDNQQRVITGLTASVSKNWQVSLSYEYLNNNSNRQGIITTTTTAETATYSRGVTSLSLDWYF